MEEESTYSTIVLQNLVTLATNLALISTLWLLLRLKRPKNSDDTQTPKLKPSCTLAVLGSGGHTTEMIRLLSSLNKDHYQPFYYIVADTDTTSVKRLNNVHEQAKMKMEDENKKKCQEYTMIPPNHTHIFKIPRAREVGQSYITSIFTTIHSILSSAHIVLCKTKPEILIINGPGTCIPIAFWTYIGRMVGICKGKTIFCESFCRVTSLSLTGKILVRLKMVDLFLVHWQELMDTIDRDYCDVKMNSGIKFLLIDSFMQDTSNAVNEKM